MSIINRQHILPEITEMYLFAILDNRKANQLLKVYPKHQEYSSDVTVIISFDRFKS